MKQNIEEFPLGKCGEGSSCIFVFHSEEPELSEGLKGRKDAREGGGNDRRRDGRSGGREEEASKKEEGGREKASIQYTIMERLSVLMAAYGHCQLGKRSKHFGGYSNNKNTLPLLKAS